MYLEQMDDVAREQLERKQILPAYGKMYRQITKSPELSSKAMEEQFTRLICLTYQGKQNGSAVSTNNQCME